MKVPDLLREGIKLHAEVDKKNRSSIPAVVKKEKEMCTSSVVGSQTAQGYHSVC